MMAIKVLHLIDSGGLYGAEMMLLNLVEEQVKSGLKPLILSAGTPGVKNKALEVEAKRRGLPIKQFRMSAGMNFVKAFQVVSFAKKERFDILHSHGYKFNILIGMFPRFVRKIPLVTTLHGYTSADGLSLIRIYQILERMLLKSLEGVIFVSGEIKNNPVLKGFKGRSEAVIFNGIDASKIIAAADDAGSVSIKAFFPQEHDKCIYLGAIGRLSQEKGFDFLIDVFSELLLKEPRLRLVIIGEGELRNQLEEKIKRLCLTEKVSMPGFVKSAYRLMSELDGVVMPSYTEGLPMTILEACVLNKRIVASNVGSIAEVLQGYDESIVVEPGDSEKLAAAIEKLIIINAGEPVRKEGWASKRFSSSSMSKQYHEFYGKVIQSQCAPGSES